MIKYSIEIILLIIIIIMAILGDKFKFYQLFKWWDLLSHFIAGITFAKIGYVFTENLLVAFMFAITLQTMWEIYEFLNDEYFGTNMQRRYYTINMPDSRIKSAAIRDTMTDTISYSLGAVLMIIIILIYMYH